MRGNVGCMTIPNALTTSLLIILSVLIGALFVVSIVAVFAVRQVSSQLRVIARESRDILDTTRTNLTKTTGVMSILGEPNGRDGADQDE